jgi:2-dehydropantoate 2-reductase
VKIKEVIIIGRGNVGLLTAYFASQLGISVVFTGSRYKQIDSQSYTVTDSQLPPQKTVGKEPLTLTTTCLPLTSIEFTKEMPVFISVKSHQLEPCLYQIKDHIAEGTHIYLMQNGMGHISCASGILSHCNIRAISITSGVNSSEDKLNIVNYGSWHIGCENNQEPTEFDQTLIDQFAQLELDIEWSKDIRRVLFGKLLINSAINPITAIYDVLNGHLLDSRFKPLLNNISEELSLFCHHKGYQYTPEDILKIIHHVAHNTSSNISSMRQDVLNSRETEIDSILGYVLAQFPNSQTQLPTLFQLYKQIKQIESEFFS